MRISDDARGSGEVTFLAALAEPTRLRIVWHLRGGPLTVGAIAQAVGRPIMDVSHHLGVLYRAGVLARAKKGQFVAYSLHPAAYTAGRPEALARGGLRLVLG